MVRCFLYCCLLLGIIACQNSPDSKAPTIGFLDAFEDSTIKQAKDGFLDALKAQGFSEVQGTVKILYRNAQGNIPTLTQIVQYFISQKVTLIAANASLSTITALQNTQEIPIFMMVSPTPELMKVNDPQGTAPSNLFGVAEDLAYIDTSFSLIPSLVRPAAGRLKIGLLFNQSEPQSVEAFNRIEELASRLGVELIALPVNTTADVQLVTNSILSKKIDAFFANPDNTVFASFETIISACNAARVPVFTSEAGLVVRGAVAAYGADLYQWGYQAGQQAAQFLKNKSLEGLRWEMVKVRKRVYNPTAAQRFDLTLPTDFEPIVQ